MMFFNPGKKIPGIPFIGDKIDIFDADVAQYYDFSIDMDDHEWTAVLCIFNKGKNDLPLLKKIKLFLITLLPGSMQKQWKSLHAIMISVMTQAVYDFDVHMEVQMTKFGNYLVPKQYVIQAIGM